MPRSPCLPTRSSTGNVSHFSLVNDLIQRYSISNIVIFNTSLKNACSNLIKDYEEHHELGVMGAHTSFELLMQISWCNV